MFISCCWLFQNPGRVKKRCPIRLNLVSDTKKKNIFIMSIPDCNFSVFSSIPLLVKPILLVVTHETISKNGDQGETHGYTINLIVTCALENEMGFSGGTQEKPFQVNSA